MNKKEKEEILREVEKIMETDSYTSFDDFVKRELKRLN